MDDCERRHQELEAANQPLLHAFHGHLFKKRVGKKKSTDHVNRLAFFANEYLLNYEELPLEEGYDEISSFLGDWFIRKCMWSDESSLRENIDTFRRFYDFLHLDGRIDQDPHQQLHQLIDDSEAIWFRHLRRFNDPSSIDLEDVWNYGESDEPDEGTQARASRHFVIMLSGHSGKHFKVRTSTLPKTEKLDGESHWLDCWRCELIAEHRPSKTVYFLLTNAKTLFSVVIPNDDRRIESLVSILSQLVAREAAQLRPDICLQEGGTFSIVRGHPRSLIGSQNELIRCTLHLFEGPIGSLESIRQKLNHIPMMTLETTFPDDAFQQLEADPPSAPSLSTTILPFPPPSSN